MKVKLVLLLNVRLFAIKFQNYMLNSVINLGVDLRGIYLNKFVNGCQLLIRTAISATFYSRY